MQKQPDKYATARKVFNFLCRAALAFALYHLFARAVDVAVFRSITDRTLGAYTAETERFWRAAQVQGAVHCDGT
jgi:hypothetical protein